MQLTSKRGEAFHQASETKILLAVVTAKTGLPAPSFSPSFAYFSQGNGGRDETVYLLSGVA